MSNGPRVALVQVMKVQLAQSRDVRTNYLRSFHEQPTFDFAPFQKRTRPNLLFDAMGFRSARLALADWLWTHFFSYVVTILDSSN